MSCSACLWLTLGIRGLPHSARPLGLKGHMVLMVLLDLERWGRMLGSHSLWMQLCFYQNPEFSHQESGRSKVWDAWMNEWTCEFSVLTQALLTLQRNDRKKKTLYILKCYIVWVQWDPNGTKRDPRAWRRCTGQSSGFKRDGLKAPVLQLPSSPPPKRTMHNEAFGTYARSWRKV